MKFSYFNAGGGSTFDIERARSSYYNPGRVRYMYNDGFNPKKLYLSRDQALNAMERSRLSSFLFFRKVNFINDNGQGVYPVNMNVLNRDDINAFRKNIREHFFDILFNESQTGNSKSAYTAELKDVVNKKSESDQTVPTLNLSQILSDSNIGLNAFFNNASIRNKYRNSKIYFGQYNNGYIDIKSTQREETKKFKSGGYHTWKQLGDSKNWRSTYTKDSKFFKFSRNSYWIRVSNEDDGYMQFFTDTFDSLTQEDVNTFLNMRNIQYSSSGSSYTTKNFAVPDSSENEKSFRDKNNLEDKYMSLLADYKSFIEKRLDKYFSDKYPYIINNKLSKFIKKLFVIELMKALKKNAKNKSAGSYKIKLDKRKYSDEVDAEQDQYQHWFATHYRKYVTINNYMRLRAKVTHSFSLHMNEGAPTLGKELGFYLKPGSEVKTLKYQIKYNNKPLFNIDVRVSENKIDVKTPELIPYKDSNIKTSSAVTPSSVYQHLLTDWHFKLYIKF